MFLRRKKGGQRHADSGSLVQAAGIQVASRQSFTLTKGDVSGSMQ